MSRSGSGIGRAAAMRLAREGATVGLLGHTKGDLGEIADEIAQSGEWAASPGRRRARHITGTPIHIDAGQPLMLG